MKPLIHLVTLGVKDLERSRLFYEKGLGLKASRASQGEIVFFSTGGAVLALYPWKALAKDAGVFPKGSGFQGMTLAHNVEKKSRVAQVLRKVQAAGGKIVKPAQDAFWGGHSGYFTDPDGHLWEVAWNPHFPFAKDGSLKLPI
jgi:catechol 2,3-dioxygenase-like lactoylglutathione lyase family enzyme